MSLFCPIESTRREGYKYDLIWIRIPWKEKYREKPSEAALAYLSKLKTYAEKCGEGCSFFKNREMRFEKLLKKLEKLVQKIQQDGRDVLLIFIAPGYVVDKKIGKSLKLILICRSAQWNRPLRESEEKVYLNSDFHRVFIVSNAA